MTAEPGSAADALVVVVDLGAVLAAASALLVVAAVGRCSRHPPVADVEAGGEWAVRLFGHGDVLGGCLLAHRGAQADGVDQDVDGIAGLLPGAAAEQLGQELPLVAVAGRRGQHRGCDSYGAVGQEGSARQLSHGGFLG